MEPSIKHKKSIINSDDEHDLNGILNLWKKFTLKNDSPCTDTYHHLFYPHHQAEPIKKSKNVTIYLKSPYALSGGIMEGTIALCLIPKKKVIQMDLVLHGIEIVFDPAHYSTSTHAHHFLNLPILTLQQPSLHLDQSAPEDKKKIPFSFQMPLDLGSTYKDKKGCVQYTLQCHVKIQSQEKDENEEIWFTDRPLHVYQNALGVKSGTNQALFYHPINEHRRIWERRRSSILSSPSTKEISHVDVNMNLPRSIWTSGSLLYVNMKMENKSMHIMRDVKLDLIKRQNTYWQAGLLKTFDLMPVTSTCELISSTSLLSLGWWQALDPQSNDHVMIPLEIPAHEFTIKHQKLIDVSFAIRISITSSTSTDAIIEIPITLVHPISADPPISTFCTVSPSKSNCIKSLPCSPSISLFQRSGQHEPNDHHPLALPFPSSASSSSIWSSGSLVYSPFMPMATNSASPPPPPLPPKQPYQEKYISSSFTNFDNRLTLSTTSLPQELIPLNDHIYTTDNHRHQNQTSASTLKSLEKRTGVVTRRKKLTMVDACEALVHHTADRCKSAFFSSSWTSAIFNVKKKSLVQKLSRSFSSGIKSSSSANAFHPSAATTATAAVPLPLSSAQDLSKIPTCENDTTTISPSGTMFAVAAPSQKFEISVQELDFMCPTSPVSSSPSTQCPPHQRRRKGLRRLWSLKLKKKPRQAMGSQTIKSSLDSLKNYH